MTDLKVEYKNIKELIPYCNNSRTHSDEQVLQIASSIKEFGFTNPVLIDGQGGIIAGHGRIMAAQKLKMDEVPTITLNDLSEAQKKAYIIADNKLALNSGWDDELLKIELEQLKELDFDLGLIGFSDDELALLMGGETTEGLVDEDQVPELVDNPVTVLGDVWLLGNHRLMCGSSTEINSVSKLFNGNKVDIVFTSPPYNVGKTPNGNDNKYNNYDDKNANYLELLNDFTTNYLMFSEYVFSNIQSVAGNKRILIEHMYQLKEKFADTIIWDKGSAEPAMARKVLNSRFEYIHIFSNDAKRVVGVRDFRGTIDNIFTLNSRAGKEFAKIHKATFRVELPEKFIKCFCEGSIADAFAGTGSTLIAAEKNGIESYNMELDPCYCDVIIKRWQDFTGKQATLESNGKTYIELLNDNQAKNPN